ncbi:hypothetical protein GOP47_0011780 [Adiantum capillus-veneris]|uniref:Uncharacterized protein n=1 Tax=Adiantum capillus-veneris TaxID=13818 RepID=A0A9D4UUT0_ADICA|nr:hypothetical protein GOP47_0011780 [Adiantum capillus-veneris]
MVQPDCVDPWRCKKSMHGGLQASDRYIGQVFDGAREQVHRDGALASRSCEGFLLLQVTEANGNIPRLRTTQGVLDTGSMRLMIWDFERNAHLDHHLSRQRSCPPGTILVERFLFIYGHKDLELYFDSAMACAQSRSERPAISMTIGLVQKRVKVNLA